MKTVLVFVTTLDGKVTRWNDPLVKRWTSKEDKAYFSKTIRESKLIIMGSNTFNAEPINPAETRLILVMTRNPDQYKHKEVPGKLEFTSDSPVQLVEKYGKKGYGIMHVVGGPKIATSFLKKQLVDELWLTIEPKIFGTGDNLVSQENMDIQLELISCEKVNQEGTLILKYKILNQNKV